MPKPGKLYVIYAYYIRCWKSKSNMLFILGELQSSDVKERVSCIDSRLEELSRQAVAKHLRREG